MVASGAPLTIEPGVEVYFEKDFGLTVLGRLLALGPAEHAIRFTGTQDRPSWWSGIYAEQDNPATSAPEIHLDRGPGDEVQRATTSRRSPPRGSWPSARRACGKFIRPRQAELEHRFPKLITSILAAADAA
jgi:hypothetical protein